MKKILFMAEAGLSLALLLSCNFQKPQSISLSTSANYTFSAGEMDLSDKLSDDFSINSMIQNAAADSGFTVYDYNPGNKTGKDVEQQYLIEVPFDPIPIDFETYLNNFGDGTSIDPISKEIQVPELDDSDLTQSKEIDLESLNDDFNKGLTITGQTGENSEIKICMEEAGSDFDYVEYESGSFIVYIYSGSVVKDSDDNYQLETGLISGEDGKEVTITTTDSDGNPVSRSGTVSGGKATIDISNFQIKSGMMLNYNGTADKNYVGVIDSGKIKEVTGLTYSYIPDDSELSSQTFNLGSSDIKAFEIGTGSLTSTFQITDWTGYKIGYSIAIEDGLTDNSGNAITMKGTATPSSDGKCTKSLAGAKYTSDKDIKITPKLSIQFKNATVKFNNPKMTFVFAIQKLNSATIDATSYLSDLQVSVDPIDISSAGEYISKIVWNKAGVKFTYSNGLPSGNDIGLTLSSDFLELSDKAVTLVSNSTDKTAEVVNLACNDTLFAADTYSYTDIGSANSGREYNKVDFTVDITLPNYDSDNKLFTLKSIVPGETYTINIAPEALMNWYEVILKTDKFAATGKTAISMSLSSMTSGLTSMVGEDLVDNIKLSEIDMELYSNLDDLPMENPAFNGTIKAYIGDASGDTPSYAEISDKASYTKYILGSEGVKETKESGTIPELTKVKGEKKADATGDTDDDYYWTVINSNLSAGTNVADLMNNVGENEALVFDYDVGFSCQGSDSSEIAVKYDDVKDKGTSEIKLSAYVTMPLNFSITEKDNGDGTKQTSYDIDLMSMMGRDFTDTAEHTYTNQEKDLLNREDKDSFSSEYLEIIQTASVSYSISALPFKAANGINMKINLDPDNVAGGVFTEETYPLNTGKSGTISVNPDDLLEVYPFNPELKVEIPTGTISILRNFQMAASLKAGIKCSGKKVTVWSANETKD